jgi:hypothetical protein
MNSLLAAGAVLWLLLALSVVVMGIWACELALGWFRYESPEIEHPPSEVQVRILTIGLDPAVVQQTVDALPATVSDIHVVSEQAIAIEGAVVDVVPESYTCTAEKKGRALEWARTHVPCDREYILYLDEDSQAIDFKGVPDADIIQFGEQPFRTGSRLAYWLDVFRMGFQIEMRAFPKLTVPLYAWGGGIAVRRELEDQVTWDFKSIVEDTGFVWRAARDHDIDMAYVDTKFRNQAPPSLRALISQRRRWYAGSISEVSTLPFRYHLITWIRNVSWSVTALMPLVWLAALLPVSGSLVPFQNVYLVIAPATFSFLFVWAVIGGRYMDESLRVTAAICLLAPVLSFLNGVGALYGAVDSPEDFDVTEKSADNTMVTEIDAD